MLRRRHWFEKLVSKFGVHKENKYAEVLYLVILKRSKFFCFFIRSFQSSLVWRKLELLNFRIWNVHTLNCMYSTTSDWRQVFCCNIFSNYLDLQHQKAESYNFTCLTHVYKFQILLKSETRRLAFLKIPIMPRNNFSYWIKSHVIQDSTGLQPPLPKEARATGLTTSTYIWKTQLKSQQTRYCTFSMPGSNNRV